MPVLAVAPEGTAAGLPGPEVTAVGAVDKGGPEEGTGGGAQGEAKAGVDGLQGARLGLNVGTGGEPPGGVRLGLVVREPHAVVAEWQGGEVKGEGGRGGRTEGPWVLRVFEGGDASKLVEQLHVPADRRIQAVGVEHAGGWYVAELGRFGAEGEWQSFARSQPVQTPPEGPAEERTFPLVAGDWAQVRPREFVETVGAEEDADQEVGGTERARLEIGFGRGEEGEEGMEGACEEGEGVGGVAGELAAWAEAELADVPVGETSAVLARRERVGLVGRKGGGPGQGERSMGAGEGGPREAIEPGGPGEGTASQGLGRAVEAPTEFWFNLNADLVVYGGTVPGSRVVVGGREVALRADGTFTLRFTLPDGRFVLEALAVAKDGSEGRSAQLRLERGTDYGAGTGVASRRAGLEELPSV